MTRSSLLLIVCVGTVCRAPALFAEDPPPDLGATLESVRTQTGSAYLAARDQLFSKPLEVVRPRLQAMKQQAANPLEDLVWDALIIRLEDRQQDDSVFAGPRPDKGEVGPVRRTVRLKVEFAIDEALYRAGLDVGPSMRKPTEEGDPPVRRPSSGAGVLLRHLGDDAAPIAAELLYKGLAADWEPWERKMLLLTFFRYGWWRADPERATKIKDVRAGWALLWMAEHQPDESLGWGGISTPSTMPWAGNRTGAEEDLARMAAYYLSMFPDPELLQAARAARDRSTDERRRLILSRAVENIESTLPYFEEMRARLEREAASQPASQPAD